MSLLEQQTDKRFLLFESQLNKDSSEETHHLHRGFTHWVWSTRLIFINVKGDNEFWNFTVLDLLMNKTQLIRFRKTNNTFNRIKAIYSLNNEFGFIVEDNHGSSRANIVKINWELKEFQLINYVEQECSHFSILIDKMEPSKFVLQWRSQILNITYNYQVGKLVNGKIKIGEAQRIGHGFHFYSKDRFINISTGVDTGIIVYNLITKGKQSFRIGSLPKQFQILSCYEWINDRLYTSIYFQVTQKQGIVWADFETKKWNLLKFDTNLWIKKLEIFGGNLIVDARQLVGRSICPNEVKYYDISMRKPNSLRRSAWILVVNVMKQRGEKDPYEAAKEFLPLNSDLREIWFKDEEQK